MFAPLALFALLVSPGSAPVGAPVVAGHVTLASAVRLESAITALYTAIGMDGLFDPRWIAADLGEQWPAGDATGVDRIAPLGWILLADSAGHVSAAPFGRIADERGFETALATAGWHHDPARAERIVCSAKPGAAIETERERYLVVRDSGEVVVVPSADLVEVVRGYAPERGLWSGSDETTQDMAVEAHFDFDAALPRIGPALQAKCDLKASWDELQEIFVKTGVAKRKQATVSDWMARMVPRALALANQWRAVDVGVALGRDAITAELAITTRSETPSAAFVRTLAEHATPAFASVPADAALVLESGGDAPLLADVLVGAGIEPADGASVRGLRAVESGESGWIVAYRPTAAVAERCLFAPAVAPPALESDSSVVPPLVTAARAAAKDTAAARFAVLLGALFETRGVVSASRGLVTAFAHAQGETLRVTLRVDHAELAALVPEVNLK